MATSRIQLLLHLLSLYTVITRAAGSQCPPGKTEVFLLTADINPNVRSYHVTAEGTFAACVYGCSRQSRCIGVSIRRTTPHSLFRCQYLETSPNLDALLANKHSQTTDIGRFYLEKICLKGMCKSLFAAELVYGAHLEDRAAKTIANTTKEKCFEDCNAEKDFSCRSTSFNLQSGLCQLSKHDRYDRRGSFVKQNALKFVYMENSCSSHIATDDSTADIMFLGDVPNRPFAISEHRGLTVGDCGQRCLRNQDFHCRSFLFGTNDGTSYCGLSHQDRANSLKLPLESNLRQEGINVYEIVRNLANCASQDIQFEMSNEMELEDLPYQVAKDKDVGECVAACRKDLKCRSAFHRDGNCKLYTVGARDGRQIANGLKQNSTSLYFQKICISASAKCEGRWWSFEKIPLRGLSIPKSHGKTVTAYSKEECLFACLDNQDFVCQSVGFNIYISECYLSPYNRFSSHNPLYRAQIPTPGVDYFENNCLQESRGFCNFRTIQGAYLDMLLKNITTENEKECRNMCFQEKSFSCRSFSFNQKTKQCSLSHQGALGPVRTDPDYSTTVNQITSCYNVSVSCEPHFMMVNIETNNIFDGKVYSQDAPNSCVLDVTSSTNFSIPIPLTGSQCNTNSEGEGKFSNIIVIQNNDLVLTSTDKAIGVHCSYQTGNKTEFAVITIKNLTTKEIARGRASPPHVSLRILDIKGNDRTSVKLGEPLRVQVIASDNSPYGIFVRNMVATDASRSTNLTLIDSRGCPAEARMIKEMRRIDGHRRALESVLEAFTFTGSNILRIETDVETCLADCTPVTCNLPMGRSDEEYTAVESFGKRKRRDSPSIQVFKLTKSIDINDENFGVGQQFRQNSYTVPITVSPNFEGDFENADIADSASSEDENCVKPSVLIAIGCAFVAAQILLLVTFLGLKVWRSKKLLVVKDAPSRTMKSNKSNISSKVSNECRHQFQENLP